MTDIVPNVLDSDETRSLLDSFPDPAFILDRQHRIRSVNRAYHSTFADGDAVLGRRCYEVLHHQVGPCVPDGHGCPLLDCSRHQRSARCLHVHHGPDREEHQHVSVHPIRRRDGALIGFLQTFRAFTAASAVPHPRRLVGRSPAFNRMLDQIRSAARSEIPVLLLGEPGTGKRRAAEAVHELSARHRGPFVIVDLGSLGKLGGDSPPELRAPSPTASQALCATRIEAARGGTLLLSELGDLPSPLRGELRELLENEAFRYAGGGDGNGAEVRLVCTSSRDLGSLARSGAFGPDLCARINVFPILVPPLRERLEDLPLLIDSLLQRIVGHRHQFLHPDALASLGAYDFPGNIRELFSILERACLLAEGDTILPEHLQGAWSPPAGLSASLPAGVEILSLDEVERRYLEWAVRTFNGDNATLAKKLGIAERTLYRKLRELRTEGPPSRR